MDIWIKSQNRKRLAHSELIEQKGKRIDISCNRDIKNVKMAVYDSTERAYEILQEIENYINQDENTRIEAWNSRSVYPMPVK